MGQIIPITPPTIDDSKIYCVTVRGFYGPAEDCSGPYIDTCCCPPGWLLKEWLADECKPYHEICYLAGILPEYFIALFGPFDSNAQCWAYPCTIRYY